MKTRKRNTAVLILFVSIIILSCTIFVGGPSYPEQSIPISTESISELQTMVAGSMTLGESSGTVTITITEVQLTSYISMIIEKNPKSVIKNPQVYLRDGEIQFFSTATQGYFQATIAFILSIGVDDTGKLKLEFTSIDIGPLPASKVFENTITALLEEAFTGSIGPIASGIRLTDAKAVNGFLIIQGQIK